MLPLLLTPGPLSTHPETRAAMAVDRGSRDPAFVAMDAQVWTRIAALVRAEDPRGDDWVAVPLQGSGTFAVEAMLGTLLPRQGRVLVLANGAYGERMARLVEVLGRPLRVLRVAEEAPIDPAVVGRILDEDPSIGHVAMVHNETTTGALNPLAEVALVVQARGRRLLVDAMSAFGAIPLGEALPAIEAVAASANKCLEGVPGLAFVLVRRADLAAAKGRAHSLSLDLHDQQARREQDGQWRFTPPTHVIAALSRALDLHAAEGGVEGRGARYRENCRVLVAQMTALGFQVLLPPERQGPIIVTFLMPSDPAWRFPAIYEALVDRGFAIYPGKLTLRDTFRVGCIGQVFPADLHRFASTLSHVMAEQGIASGAP